MHKVGNVGFFVLLKLENQGSQCCPSHIFACILVQSTMSNTNLHQSLFNYRSGTVNSNTVDSKFHLIRSYCEIFFYNFPNIHV